MDANVVEAISTASASTVVSFTLESNPITLFASLDSDNGGLRWLQDTRADGAILRHVHTKKWLVPMLNDAARNECYAEAIRRSFRPTQAGDGRRTFAALDVGTGTGLLAMLVASRFEEVAADPSPLDGPPQVLSVEMEEPMAELARRIIECNGLQQRIKVTALHSTSLPSPPPNAAAYSICTSELLDYQLVGEGIIPTLRDLHSRGVLSPSAAVVPSSARIHARVLSSTTGFKDYCDSPSAYGGLKLPPDDQDSSPPIVAFQPTLLPESSYLTPAFSTLDFSFTSSSAFPSSRRSRSKVVASGGGEAVAVLFWWTLGLADGVEYNGRPGARGRFQDHWPASVYVLPRSGRAAVAGGEEIEVAAAHDDGTVWFEVKAGGGREDEGEPSPKRSKPDPDERTDDVSRPPFPALTSTRIRQLSSPARAAFFGSFSPPPSSSVLDLSDSSLCGLLACAVRGVVGPVTCVHSSSLSSARRAGLTAQVHNGQGPERLRVLHGRYEEVVGEAARVGVVCGEPYYEKMEDNLVMSALNLHYAVGGALRRAEAGGGEREVSVFPERFRVMAVGVEFGSGTPLHKSYACPSDVVGFDHTELQAVVAKGRKDLPFELVGQYEFERVTSEAILANVRVGKEDIPPESVASMSALPGRARRMDAVVVWVDFEHGESSFTTFDEYHGQRVIFLNEGSRRVVSGEEVKCMFKAGGDGDAYEVLVLSQGA